MVVHVRFVMSVNPTFSSWPAGRSMKRMTHKTNTHKHNMPIIVGLQPQATIIGSSLKGATYRSIVLRRGCTCGSMSFRLFYGDLLDDRTKSMTLKTNA